MRIGYVLKKFPRYSETFVLREILALESLGVPVQVLSIKPPLDGRFHEGLARLAHAIEYLPRVTGKSGLAEILDRLRGSGLDRGAVARVFLEGLDRDPPSPLQEFAAGLLVAARLEPLGITHLHAHFATSATEVARLASRMTGVPYSFTCHAKDIYQDDVDREGLHRKFEESRFAVTVCEANQGYLAAAIPASREKLLRLYNGIDLDHWSEDPGPGTALAPPWSWPWGGSWRRRASLFLDTLSILAERRIPFRGRILGDGELLPSLRLRVRDLGLADRVDLPGAVSSEQVRESMREATALVCPSIQAVNGDRDALPTVLLEAMAARLPTVATRVGGIPEILDGGRAGLLADPDPADLAGALERLLTEAGLRAELAHRGRARAEDLFDIGKNARILAAAFAGGLDAAKEAVVEGGAA